MVQILVANKVTFTQQHTHIHNFFFKPTSTLTHAADKTYVGGLIPICVNIIISNRPTCNQAADRQHRYNHDTTDGGMARHVELGGK